MLSPNVSALERREQQRIKEGYGHYSPGALDETLRRARPGRLLARLERSDPDETVDDILAHLDRAAV